MTTSAKEAKIQPFTEHTVAVMFCDLIGSTGALRELGTVRFQRFQDLFVTRCIEVKDRLNQNRAAGSGELVIDKFMGDGVMLYLVCGSDHAELTEACSHAAAQMMHYVAGLLVGLLETLAGRPVDHDFVPALKKRRIGLRFGVAIGGDVALSTLGKGDSGSSDTLTGEIVNLAARLEHATAEEFLRAIADARSRTDEYARSIKDPATLHGTGLADRLAIADRQVIDLADVCEKRFQIRATKELVDALEKAKASDSRRLMWREIPFAPRGFDGQGIAKLLGGDNLPELFREA